MRRGWRFRQTACQHGAVIGFFAPHWSGAGAQRPSSPDVAQIGPLPGPYDGAEKPNDFNAGPDGPLGQHAKSLCASARDTHMHASAGEAPRKSAAVLAYGPSSQVDHMDHVDQPKNERAFPGPHSVGRFGPSGPDDDRMPAGAGVCPCCNEVRWLRDGPTTTLCDRCALLADEAETCMRGENP